MSSLALLMQNYSDSEDERSSDEEEKKIKLRRSKDEETIEEELKNDLSEESKEDKLNDKEFNLKELEKQNKIKLIKEESNQSSSELAPSLKKIKLDKLDEKNTARKQRLFNYSALLMQNYSDSEDERSSDEGKKRELRRSIAQFLNDDLEDDFHTSNKIEDDEMDTIECDEDNSNPSIIDVDTNEKEVNESKINSNNSRSSNNSSIDKLDCSKYSPKSYHRLLIGINEENIQIPDAPKDKHCSKELIEKIKIYHEKMKKENTNIIEVIQQKKPYRNPSIYEKLIVFCNIDEFGTNLPEEIFDPNQFKEKEEHDQDS